MAIPAPSFGVSCNVGVGSHDRHTRLPLRGNDRGLYKDVSDVKMRASGRPEGKQLLELALDFHEGAEDRPENTAVDSVCTKLFSETAYFLLNSSNNSSGNLETESTFPRPNRAKLRVLDICLYHLAESVLWGL